MNPQNRKYFVIIVQYGDPNKTQKALASICHYSPAPDHIIVVDQGTEPLKLTEKLTQEVTIIRRKGNNGYAAAINTGFGALVSLGATENDIVVVMNNDITFSSDTFHELRQWWNNNPTDALLGVSIHERNLRLSGAGEINLINGRLNLLTNSDFIKRPNLLEKPSSILRKKIPCIHGALFAAPFRVFLRLQGLSEKYFMYWEDADLSVRAARLNIPLRLASQVQAIHHCTAIDKIENYHLYYLVRNGAIFLEKETPFLWRKYWWLLNRLRFLYHSSPLSQKPLVRQALIDAIKGKLGKTYRP